MTHPISTSHLPRKLRRLCLFAALSCHALASSPAQQPPPSPASPPVDATSPKVSPSAHTAEEDQPSPLEADTARLYRMVQDFQKDLAKSDPNTLSLGLIRKADEIEKLAAALKKTLRQQSTAPAHP